MTWLSDARARIRSIDATLPADATLKQRRTALRAEAWKHHRGTTWGKKTWSIAAREYLEQHGLPPRIVRPSAQQHKLSKAITSGDIVLMKDMP